MHKAKDSNWSETSYIKICNFNDIETFWSYNKILNNQLFNDKMIFVMKEDVKPIWEDPKFRNGGYWSFKVSNSNILNVFTQIVIKIITNNIQHNSGHVIYGVSTSPKRGFHIIKIWNDNDKKSNICNLNLDHIDIPKTEFIYTSFKRKKN